MGVATYFECIKFNGEYTDFCVQCTLQCFTVLAAIFYHGRSGYILAHMVMTTQASDFNSSKVIVGN